MDTLVCIRSYEYHSVGVNGHSYEASADNTVLVTPEDAEVLRVSHEFMILRKVTR